MMVQRQDFIVHDHLAISATIIVTLPPLMSLSHAQATARESERGLARCRALTQRIVCSGACARARLCAGGAVGCCAGPVTTTCGH